MTRGSTLDDRERAVLRSIVDLYVGTAQPVASERVVEETRLGLSSATIRGVMSRMEERGLLRQPHTSAGRVPTDRGYRVYVDELMGPVSIGRREQEELLFGVERLVNRPDQLPGSMSALLANVSGLAGFASPPRIDRGIYLSLHADLVRDGRVAMVLVLDSGFARSALCPAEEGIDEKSLASGVEELNRRFRGRAVEEIRDFLFGPDWEENLPALRVMRLFRKAAEELLETGRMARITLSGVESLLLEPEFRSSDELVRLSERIEGGSGLPDPEKDALADGGVALRIGAENDEEELTPFSILAAEYRFGRFTGIMGMIGPTRMRYGRGAAIVDFARRIVEQRIVPFVEG
ncbi:MAG: heat-inducible transcription repressor HrcA [Candidatus Eisenbacteria bacterium]|nr:heat-inducible transcription repressor HrcA [Candidatus Eisenbacteria bacterium]